MIDFERIVEWHCGVFPLVDVQDLIKLAYQSVYGSEHMLPDAETVVERLRSEAAATEPSPDRALFTPIGGGLCRLNLAALPCSGLRIETVAELFRCAARERDEDALEDALDTIERMAAAKRLPLSIDNVVEGFMYYRMANCPAVHHSQRYRDNYHPAYRIVPVEAAAYLPVFQRIDALIAKGAPVRIAVDGMCASGKTTLASLLAKVYHANLFHMDDFFLPADRKAPERLAQPGGNADYERFDAEILSRDMDKPFFYRPYNCSAGGYAPAVGVPVRDIWIVEGAYSMHPSLRDRFDLKIGMGIDPGLQSARILRRNGEAMHCRFLQEWIPLENRYIEAENLWQQCDVVCSASDIAGFFAKFEMTWRD